MSETPVAGRGQEPGMATYLRLILLAALIGIPAALVAAGFLALVHYLQHWLWEELPEALGYSSPPWYLVLLLPVAGAALVLAARRLLPGDGGHRPLEGLGIGLVPISHGLGIALAAIATLAFGGVLGPEAPLVALGAIVGLIVTSFAKHGERERGVLATAGSFSAISALFGGPLVGGVLMVEGAIGLGAAALPLLLPGFVAAAVGYVVIIGFGDWGGLDVAGLAVPDLPLYDGPHPGDMFLAVCVGVLTALLVLAVQAFAKRAEGPGQARFGLPAVLLGGGAAIGALALLADALGADSQDVLFSGQASVPTLAAEDSTKIVLVLLVAKALAYGVSLGCGFRGGPVFPAIFLGIAIAELSVIWFDTSPTWAIAVGAAAGTAAVTGLLLSSMVLATLLVGAVGVDAVPSAVLAASTAWLVVKGLERRGQQVWSA
ncbi:MAG TPA: chloride channel protein [Gaiellaceae bacterium]|jgi:chloride channel protein, CIC family|nr:chloride channel protein [Gaiellaceae bacterium]